MSEFLYVYRNEPATSAPSPEQMQIQMQKWVVWMKDLGEKGHLKDRGNALEWTGKVVRGTDNTVTDGPYAEAKDLVSGYTMIEAADLDEAVALSKGCPIFLNGGLVEVRPIMTLPM